MVEPYIADPNDFARMNAKLPSHINKEQQIPTVEQQKAIGKILLYNGLWVALTYSASLTGLFLPWLGRGIKALIKWRLPGWEQKELGSDIKDLIKK